MRKAFLFGFCVYASGGDEVKKEPQAKGKSSLDSSEVSFSCALQSLTCLREKGQNLWHNTLIFQWHQLTTVSEYFCLDSEEDHEVLLKVGTNKILMIR